MKYKSYDMTWPDKSVRWGYISSPSHSHGLNLEIETQLLFISEY